MSDTLPESTPPPSTTAVPASSAPTIVVRRRQRIVITIVGVIGVLAVLGAAGIWLLQRSLRQSELPVITASPVVPAALPTTGPETSSPSPTASPTTASPLYLSGEQRTNLAFTVNFARTPAFQLHIANVERTFEEPTIHLYAPNSGEAHSRLRLLDVNGQVVFDQPFKVVAEVIAETHDASVTATAAPIASLTSSEIYLVVPIDPLRIPARVEVVGQNGETFAQQAIDYETTPHVVAAFPAATDETGLLVTPSPSPTTSPLSWLRRWLQPVWAQSQPAPPGGGGVFTIVVINHNGTPLRSTVNALRAMVNNLRPWSKYRGQIRIVQVEKDVDLGCHAVEGPGGGQFPVCSRHGQIMRELSGVRWNAIVVVNPIPCNCGVATIGGPILAVGSTPSASLLGHELAHTVASLVDEYYYKFGFQGGPPGPNCFESQASCEEQKNRFPSLECAPGCRSVSQFRPHTQLMHNEFAQPYGEYDECLVEGALIDVLGGQAECEPEPSPTPSTPVVQTPNFYGGRR